MLVFWQHRRGRGLGKATLQDPATIPIPQKWVSILGCRTTLWNVILGARFLLWIIIFLLWTTTPIPWAVPKSLLRQGILSSCDESPCLCSSLEMSYITKHCLLQSLMSPEPRLSPPQLLSCAAVLVWLGQCEDSPAKVHKYSFYSWKCRFLSLPPCPVWCLITGSLQCVHISNNLCVARSHLQRFSVSPTFTRNRNSRNSYEESSFKFCHLSL